ncbi:MAG: CMP-N-acetylneuraminic acid synthetase, partial [Flammeovirgaceae bacterium]|nr:CMP-N-acetylneuraminic acid synthetase [Flammeovirgaceae bacterium]
LSAFVDLENKPVSTNRQDLEANYFICHNFWVLNMNNLPPSFDDGQPPWSFMGSRVLPYVVDYSIDVHSVEDIYLTEAWLRKNTQ